MADEYRQLIVSADQIDSAVNWVEANKVNIIKKLETLDTEVLQLSEDVLLIKGLDLQHMQNDVDDLKSSLSTLDAEVMQLTEDVLLIKGLDLQHMKSDIEDLQTNTYTKDETDEKITEKVSALVAGAPERFDTLKELADWIDSHADSAASMNSAIEKNASDISTANAAITKNAEDVATANTNITKNAEDIATVNENIQKNVDDIAAVKNSVAINKITLGTQCKNLLKTTATSQELNGITFTVNADETITTNGTTTALTEIKIATQAAIASGEYIFTCTPHGGSAGSYRTIIRAYDNNNTALTDTLIDNGNGVNFTVSTSGYVNAIIRISNNVTADNLVFEPMLRRAEITDNTYEPYTPSLQEQLNSLIARIETLEGAAIATTTTEGGE